MEVQRQIGPSDGKGKTLHREGMDVVAVCLQLSEYLQHILVFQSHVEDAMLEGLNTMTKDWYGTVDRRLTS